MSHERMLLRSVARGAGTNRCTVTPLSHLVHVHERIQLRERHSGESTMHRKALALKPGGCGGHTDHPPARRRRGYRIGEVNGVLPLPRPSNLT